GPRRQGSRRILPPPAGIRAVSRIADAFARARGENRAAFVAYLTAGDPNPDATVELASALAEAGTDVLELGVPFSDPIADGPVIPPDRRPPRHPRTRPRAPAHRPPARAGLRDRPPHP